MDQQIITGTERAPVVEDEPRLTLTQLHNLLRDAAALERAQRPIILVDRQGGSEWAGFTAAAQAAV